MMWLFVLGVLCAGALAANPLTFPNGQTTKGYGKGHDDFVEVHLKQGSITAQKQVVGAQDDRSFYAFQSIPFAEPPVGLLRFKDPVPAGPWSEHPRNGSFIPPECPQPNFESGVSGEEDCLYLNVFTPKPHVSANLPVMVWLHGGSFTYGNASFYKPLPLLTRDVVLVTVQSRLFTLGYLSTEDSVMPGNLGLKDNTLALRWVQDNIRHLGGDPNRVTIFGESSGGATVHYQMLTPHAKGLFHRAILQSGSAFCPWAMIEGHRDVAMKLGQLFKCSSEQESSSLTSHQLLDCLQKVPIRELTLAPLQLLLWRYTPSVMKPRVDGDYIPDHPAALVKEGRYNKVDLITGSTQDEGADYAMAILSEAASVKGLKENFAVAGPLALRLRETDENPEYLARRAFYHYLDELEIHENNLPQFMELIGDRIYTVCQDETASFHARDLSGTGHEVYRYQLRHRGQQSYGGKFNFSLAQQWVTHADDLQYIFESSVEPFKPLTRPDDLFVRNIMLTLWTNFAATGKPTPTQSLGFRWTPMSQSGMSYLAIKTVSDMQVDLKSKVREFWKNLPTQQNKILYPELFIDEEQKQYQQFSLQ